LGPPALPFGDGAEQGEGVAGGVGLLIGPDEAGQTVRAEHGGGHPFDLGGDDAGGVEGFADDSGAVGFVFGEGLAGPVAGDEDATATTPRCSRLWALLEQRRAAKPGPGWSGWMP
jgi:hypothetical protein